MIVQYAAAALVNDNKGLAWPSSCDSIPTSAGQEDHVSMGMTSANNLDPRTRQRRRRARLRTARRAHRNGFSTPAEIRKRHAGRLRRRSDLHRSVDRRSLAGPGHRSRPRTDLVRRPGTRGGTSRRDFARLTTGQSIGRFEALLRVRATSKGAPLHRYARARMHRRADDLLGRDGRDELEHASRKRFRMESRIRRNVAAIRDAQLAGCPGRYSGGRPS